MKAYGKKTWMIPDCYWPEITTDGHYVSHEAICVLNTGDEDAEIKVTLLYTDREPVSFSVTVAARRVRCLRTNEEKDFGRYTAAFGEQYAILLESSAPVVAQYGRAEPRAVSFYTTPGYCE